MKLYTFVVHYLQMCMKEYGRIGWFLYTPPPQKKNFVCGGYKYLMIHINSQEKMFKVDQEPTQVSVNVIKIWKQFLYYIS
jgi:hypothetical protein